MDCFLIAYLSPLDGDNPFLGIRLVLAAAGDGDAYEEDALEDLGRMPLGPRTSHDPARGTSTLLAYRHWAERAGSQRARVRGRPRVEPGAALRAGLRAPGVARLRSHGAL